MKVAVVGAGVAGLVAAHTLVVAGVDVVLYEKENTVGGHIGGAATGCVHHEGNDVDVGFTIFNPVMYPDPLIEYFEKAGLEMKKFNSSMSFSVSSNTGNKGCEWSSNNLAGLFAQKQNLVNPFFSQMNRELARFKDDVVRYLEKLQKKDDSCVQENETLGDFLNSHKYSQKFQECYVIPTCASIWPYPSEIILGFSAASILTFYWNNHLLQVFGDSQCLTVKDHSKTFIAKMVADLEAAAGSHILTKSGVTHISTTSEGVQVKDDKGGVEIFDKCIVSTRAPKALQMLGEEDSTAEERRILGAFKYSTSYTYLHQDVEELMPKNATAWAARNFLVNSEGHVYMTYWLNHLQNLGSTGLPYLVTMNPPKEPKHIVDKWQTSHLIPSLATATAAKQLEGIQGKQGIWFCGAYQGHGFHEDNIKMVPTYLESLSRTIVTRFLNSFIRTGRIQLLEVGGTEFDFNGNEKGCDLQCKLHIIRPAFYWKIATRQDLGFAAAYADGDFTCVDEENGLLDFFQIYIANRDIDRLSDNHLTKSRNKGWMVPLMWTSTLDRAISYVRYLLHNNSQTNAPHNIASHYNMSNDLFSLFLDETMQYSCAIFKDIKEPLVDAQMRKIDLLIDKAQVNSTHEVLETGFGWGGLAIQLVRRTGCHYTGITLSQEQLKFAQHRVEEAHLEDKITFQLCDYRLFPGKHKYNRIISSEMMEHLGHGYLPEYFKHCDRLLAKDGILVVQVSSVPEEMYKEHITSSEFVKEYIFPGGSLPSLNAITSAMAIASSLSVESVENYGSHYAETFHRWHDKFNVNRSKILQLGFSEKFFRLWNYYLLYCLAGYKCCTLGNLQIVFSRPGNTQSFGLSKLTN
ncbi:hypothetical protein BDL97_06G058100 [Sphagnum fallax]|nr:hypothetical protein BDL97_06G058100 [Sphagnum fallax]